MTVNIFVQLLTCSGKILRYLGLVLERLTPDYWAVTDDHPQAASAQEVDYLRNAIAKLPQDMFEWWQNQQIQPDQTEQIGTLCKWRTT